jgi:hypothetical protein
MLEEKKKKASTKTRNKKFQNIMMRVMEKVKMNWQSGRMNTKK